MRRVDVSRLLVLLVLLVAVPAMETGGLRAVDPVAAAKARHNWTWFGLDEAQAQAEAKRRMATLVVAQRDGKPQERADQAPAGAVVTVHLQGGLVLWAMASDAGRFRQEGVADAALLPWLGLGENDVVTQAKVAGRAVRVVSRDGQDFPVTLDFNAERLNLHVLKGVVVAITTG